MSGKNPKKTTTLKSKQETSKGQPEQEEKPSKSKPFTIPKIRLEKTDAIALTILMLILGYIYFSNTDAYSSLMYDEAGYITMGRTLAVEHYHGIDVQGTKESYRQPLFPLMIAASFILFGITYAAAKIPIYVSAMLTAAIMYMLVKKIYDRKTAFFAAAMSGAVPLTLQYVQNILSDIPTVLFYTLSMLSFYLGIEKKEKQYLYIGWLSFGLTFLIRYNAVLIIPSVAIYLAIKIVTKETTIKDLIKDKDFIRSPLATLIPLLPYFLYQKLTFGDAFIGLKGASGALDMPWGQGPWYFYIGNLTTYMTTIGTILAIIGALWILAKKDRFGIYTLSWLIIPLAYFSTKMLKDMRFVDAITPPFAILAALGLFKIITPMVSRDIKLDKETSSIALGSIALIYLIYASYTMILPAYSTSHALGYPTIMQAGAWIQENTPKDSVLMTASQPGHQWYSYRKTTGYPVDENKFILALEENTADYIVIDNYERMQPDYVFSTFKKAFLTEGNNLKHPEDAMSITIFTDNTYGSQTIIISRKLFLERLKETQ